MRRYFILPAIFALLLAACGGGQATTQAPPATVDSSSAATPTSSAPTADPNSGATQPPPPPTNGPREYATGEPTLPIAGTLVAPATEDPDAGKVFDVVYFNRTGGISGQPISLVVNKDGSGTLNGNPITVTADKVNEIDNMIDQIGFFGLQGVFTAPGTSADVFSYDITVERDGSSRTIKAQDGLIPNQLGQLIGILSQITGS
ncbi:MAG: hypothetical protein R3E39_21035 [Anaerolineae bacterium]